MRNRISSALTDSFAIIVAAGIAGILTAAIVAQIIQRASEAKLPNLFDESKLVFETRTKEFELWAIEKDSTSNAVITTTEATTERYSVGSLVYSAPAIGPPSADHTLAQVWDSLVGYWVGQGEITKAIDTIAKIPDSAERTRQLLRVMQIVRVSPKRPSDTANETPVSPSPPLPAPTAMRRAQWEIAMALGDDPKIGADAPKADSDQELNEEAQRWLSRVRSDLNRSKQIADGIQASPETAMVWIEIAENYRRLNMHKESALALDKALLAASEYSQTSNSLLTKIKKEWVVPALVGVVTSLLAACGLFMKRVLAKSAGFYLSKALGVVLTDNELRRAVGLTAKEIRSSIILPSE